MGSEASNVAASGDCSEYMLLQGRFSSWGVDEVNVSERKIKYVGSAASKCCCEED